MCKIVISSNLVFVVMILANILANDTSSLFFYGTEMILYEIDEHHFTLYRQKKGNR